MVPTNEDQLGALKDLQAEGKIKHIGLSEVSLRQFRTRERSFPSPACRIAIA
jgi:aryl-alcohol dehydrogenase-like predicted oxidoreductase